MRLGIKGKQVLGVTSIVGAIVVILSMLDLSRLASVSLDESRARADLLAKTIYQRAREVVGAGADPYVALKADPGLRSILESSVYSKDVTFAALVALGLSVLGATLLAQLLLRPIHVIRSGLTRLGKGELGVQLNLHQQDEFGDLGLSFNAVSERLSADRSQMAGQVANLESAVERLEDAVGVVDARGGLLFVNPAMRMLLPAATPGPPLAGVAPGDQPVPPP